MCHTCLPVEVDWISIAELNREEERPESWMSLHEHPLLNCRESRHHNFQLPIDNLLAVA
jgi:hypothetical protein